MKDYALSNIYFVDRLIYINVLHAMAKRSKYASDEEQREAKRIRDKKRYEKRYQDPEFRKREIERRRA